MAKARPITGMQLEAPLRANARLALSTRLSEAVDLRTQIGGPDDTRALHNLRIAVKRLRYTLEVFEPVVAGADAFLATLKRLQDLLGEMHDADMLIPPLAADPFRPGLHALLRRTMADRDVLYQGFADEWQAAFGNGLPDRLLASVRDGVQ